MSNTNDINFKGTDGDAQGHVAVTQQPLKPLRRGLDDGSGDDAEGHAARSNH